MSSDNQNRNAGIAAGIGVLISIAALIASIQSANDAQKIPFQTALYQARVGAMQSYARAHTHYERQIALVMADLPYNVFSPAALKFIDDAGMKETALSAHNILDADGDYAAEVKAVQGIWPEPIQNLILDAQKKAQAASKCFTILGGQTTKSGRYSPEQLSEHWDAIRTESGGPCLKLDNHKLQTQFILAGEVAIAAMQKQLTTTQSDLTPKGIF